MNYEQILSIIRQVFLFAGGIAVGKGWVDNETMVQIVGGLMAIIGSIWALKTRTKKSIVTQAAAIVPVSPTSQKAVGITEPVTPVAKPAT